MTIFAVSSNVTDMKFRIPFLLLIVTMITAVCQRERELYSPKSYEDLSGHVVCLLEGSAHVEYANKHLMNKNNTLLLEQCNHYLDSIAVAGELKEIADRWVDPANTDFHDVIRIDPIPAEPEETGDKGLLIEIS